MKKITAAVLVLLALLLTAATTAFVSPEVQNRLARAACRMAFSYSLHAAREEIQRESLSGESSVYYFTSYYLNGMLSAVEATGSERLLKKTLRVMDNMLATAVPIVHQGKTYQAWRPFNISPESGLPTPNVHFTLQAAVPFARAAAIIRKSPRFHERHEKNAERYVDFADSAVVRYWYQAKYNGQVPWIAAEHVPIWNDNATNMGLVGLFLYEATGEKIHRDIAESVAKAFQAKLAPAGRGWIWESQTIPIGSDTDNTPGSVGNQAGVPDTSHTNREVLFMTFAHEAGILFTDADLDRMAYTFIDNIWNQSYRNPSFSNYLNGSNKPYRVYQEPGLNGPIYHGWVLTGGQSPEAQKVFLHTLKAIVLGKKNPGLIRNVTSYGGMVGLTGHLLRNFMTLEKRS